MRYAEEAVTLMKKCGFTDEEIDEEKIYIVAESIKTTGLGRTEVLLRLSKIYMQLKN